MIATERERGVTLRLLDVEPMLAEAQEFLKDTPDLVEVRLGWQPWAYGVAPDGSSYVVNSEGVGWLVTDEPEPEKALVDVYTTTRRVDPETGEVSGGTGIFPVAQVVLTRSKAIELATGEEIDLADLIRTFGARLEDNFRIWRRTLTVGADA